MTCKCVFKASFSLGSMTIPHLNFFRDDFRHFLDGRITAPPIILIVLGLMIFFIAFLGCYGAIKESPKLLMAVSDLKILKYLTILQNRRFSVCRSLGNYFHC